MAGRIDLMIELPSDSIPQYRNGTIKAYAVTRSSRAAVAPDIPTVDEAGLPGLTSRRGRALGAEVHASRQSSPRSTQPWSMPWPIPPCEPRTDHRSGSRSTRPTGAGSAGRHYSAEIETWWPIIKAAGIKAE